MNLHSFTQAPNLHGMTLLPAMAADGEAMRLAALHSYAILDTPQEAEFDDIAELAARLAACPVAAVALVDDRRIWFKARRGLAMTQLCRETGFCGRTIMHPNRPFVLEDAARDAPELRAPVEDIRAYLGLPLVNSDGVALGTLCVMDVVPRHFDAATIDTLRILARGAAALLEVRRSQSQVHRLAQTDPLTGLPNRRALLDELDSLLAAGRKVAVIQADYDHFKDINHAAGHEAGDAVLRGGALRLRAELRPKDVVGRIGGDEFVILLPDIGDRASAERVATRIAAALNQTVVFDGRQLHVGVTLGIAVAPEDAATPALLMRAADDALLRTKNCMRGGIGRVARADVVRLQRDAAILGDFAASRRTQGGIEGATVRLQPIVGLQAAEAGGGAVIAFEALARWRGVQVGEVPPAALFPVIGEENAALLGHAVRELALREFALLCRAGLRGPRLALNLSTSEVGRPDIALEVAAQIARHGLTPRAVEIEITEEVLLEKVSDRTLGQLEWLRSQGARLVLDDFGTGNSGMAQLLRLPLDGIKLDKQFVQRLGADTRAEEIVRATVSLAHGLRLQVVAEGVETPLQLAMLRLLGCDAVQGFLFARPMAVADVRRMVLRRHRLFGPRFDWPAWSRPGWSTEGLASWAAPAIC